MQDIPYSGETQPQQQSLFSAMVSDRLSVFSRVVLRLYELAQSEKAASFQDAALMQIKELIPFDSSMWGSATMGPQGIDIHTLRFGISCWPNAICTA